MRIVKSGGAGKLSFPALVAARSRAGRGARVAEGDERSELALDAVDRPRKSVDGHLAPAHDAAGAVFAGSFPPPLSVSPAIRSFTAAR